jgi:hypothetical protein
LNLDSDQIHNTDQGSNRSKLAILWKDWKPV